MTRPANTKSTEVQSAEIDLTDERVLDSEPADGSQVDRAMIRRGGLAGFGGSAALFAAFGTYPIFGLPSVDEVESLTNYPELATGRIIENSLYLAALVLWALHFVALGRAVRTPGSPGRSLAPVVGVVGLTIMAAGALIHIATSELSDRYIDAAGDETLQANIVLVWQGAQSIFNTLLVTGAAVAPVAMVVLAWSLINNKVVGRLAGGIALILGVVASVGGASGVIIGASSPGVPVAVLSMFVFHALIGWRLFRS